MSGLFGSTILEVAIGLFFIYFLLSLICSSINELIAGLFKLRARYLENGVANLLADPQLSKQVLDHPLIKALGNTQLEQGVLQKVRQSFLGYNRAGLPSYIPAHTFSLALFDTLAPATEGRITVARLRKAANTLADTTLPAGQVMQAKSAGAQTKSTPSKMAVVRSKALENAPERKGAIGKALLGLIDHSQNGSSPALSVDHLQAMVGDLPNATAKETASAAWAIEHGRLNAIRTRLQALPDADVSPAVHVVINSIPSGYNAVTATVEQLPEATENQRSIKNKLREIVTDDAGVMDSVRRSLLLIPPGTARTTITSMIDTAEGDLQAVRDNVEQWFDDAMDRLSGVYKRRVQVVLLAIALVISLVLGVDTIRIITTLSTNAGLRAALVNDARDATAAGGTVRPATGTTTNAPTDPSVQLNSVLDRLQSLDVPLGYDDFPRRDPQNGSSSLGGRWILYIFEKVLGLAATIAAVSLGAPFWFDMLTKLTNMRSSGPQPAKSSDSSSSKAT